MIGGGNDYEEISLWLEHKPNATRSAESFICQRFALEPKRGGLGFRYRVFQNLCFSDT